MLQSRHGRNQPPQNIYSDELISQQQVQQADCMEHNIPSMTEKSLEKRIISDSHLLAQLEQAAGLMGITRDDLIVKILKLWEKENLLPLHGRDKLCSITPENVQGISKESLSGIAKSK